MITVIMLTFVCITNFRAYMLYLSPSLSLFGRRFHLRTLAPT